MVKKQSLLLIAGIVWLIAGLNVLIIGIETWRITTMAYAYKIGFAVLTFSVFFFAIFQPLYKKYTKRILAFEQPKPFYAFFDTRGWLIMAFMMTLGISLRKFNLAPNNFIAPFYTGLSLALSLTGLYFIKEWLFCIRR